ncbi:hypothetical protein HY212_05585 [Candidatus Pacearchaeota archaeon]|nr:hypothetical protein [Candidatus Pacearchaeota archaeon]
MGKRLEEVRFDENLRLTYPELGHTDRRRVIYDPEAILRDLPGNWIQHNFLMITQDSLELGLHYHDYNELYFTPTGGFDVRFVDNEDLAAKRYQLGPGARLLIPREISHMVTAHKGDVLAVYGTVPFDPKRLIIPKDNRILEALASMR